MHACSLCLSANTSHAFNRLTQIPLRHQLFAEQSGRSVRLSRRCVNSGGSTAAGKSGEPALKPYAEAPRAAPRNSTGARPSFHRNDANVPADATYAGYSAPQLAYIGDAEWSLHVRCRYLQPPKHFAAYRAAAERHVSAAAQASYMAALLAGRALPLSPEEAGLVAWAQGARGLTFRRKHAAGGGAQATYRAATAFEALVGYLSLVDPPRLLLLLASLAPLMQEVDEKEGRGSK